MDVVRVTTDTSTVQGTECQKKDWRSHKIGCRVACSVRDMRKDLGPEMEAKHKSFEAWCTNTGPFSHAAISALGLHSDWTRLGVHHRSMSSFLFQPPLDNYVFLVDVQTTSTVISSRLMDDGVNAELNIRFTHSIKSARCASMKEVHAFSDWRFKDGALGTEMSLAHRPGLLRILFINDGFKFPLDHYTTPVNLEPSDILGIPFKPDWLQWLRSWLEEPTEGT